MIDGAKKCVEAIESNIILIRSQNNQLFASGGGFLSPSETASRVMPRLPNQFYFNIFSYLPVAVCLKKMTNGKVDPQNSAFFSIIMFKKILIFN